jgi:hypothetical protein
MATLLNGVNEVLKRVRIINGDSGVLTGLTDTARQNYIDIAVQAWNEGLDELYTASNTSLPNELAEDTITLVTDDRDYALNTALNQLRFPLLDETNGAWITEWPGGYEDLVASQLQPSNFTGLPLFATIRPTDGQLYMDRIPTASENGKTYKYRYDKDLELTLASDTMPFKDVVFRAMVPAVAELWRREIRGEFDPGFFGVSLGRASRYLTQKQMRTSWLPR